MSPRHPENNRRFRRRTVRVLIDYATEEGMRCDYATTLGAGGVFIETDEPLAAGSRLKLRLRLPGSEELHQIEGRVVWRRGGEGNDARFAPGNGIQFTDAAASARLARELEDLE